MWYPYSFPRRVTRFRCLPGREEDQFVDAGTIGTTSLQDVATRRGRPVRPTPVLLRLRGRALPPLSPQDPLRLVREAGG